MGTVSGNLVPDSNQCVTILDIPLENIMDLLKSQRNQVFGLIEDQGFDPAEFVWQSLAVSVYRDGTYHKEEVPLLVHEPTKNFALFNNSDQPWEVSISPGKESVEETIQCEKWVAMLFAVAGWLSSLKREMKQPDLWEIVGARRKLIEDATAADAPNDTFSEAEQQAIASKLDEIKGHIVATYQLDQQQLQFLEDQFEFLKAESKKQGRRSWVQMALGSVLGMYLVKIDPAAVQHTLRQIVDTFIPYITKLLAAGT